MLIVRRRVGERIVIGGVTVITVTEVSGGGVRLGVTAPRGVLVLRGEVHDAIAAANQAAAQAAVQSTPEGRDDAPSDGSRNDATPVAREEGR